MNNNKLLENQLMRYEIRPITEEDIEPFRQAVGSVAREKLYLAFLDTPSIEMATDFIQTNIKESWPQVIAIADDTLIGWCDITGLNRHACNHVGRLGIGIIKEYRGQGIGKELIKSALSLAKKKGLTRIELTVREDNLKAIALYQNIGFVVEGKLINSLRVDGEYKNQIAMALLFG